MRQTGQFKDFPVPMNGARHSDQNSRKERLIYEK